jgi:hypothetical protein
MKILTILPRKGWRQNIFKLHTFTGVGNVLGDQSLGDFLAAPRKLQFTERCAP